jgi:hypothetical protein
MFSCSRTGGAFIDLCIGSPTGRVIATAPITATGAGKYTDFQVPVQDTNQWFMVRESMNISLFLFLSLSRSFICSLSAWIRPSFSFMPFSFLVAVCSVSCFQRWREMATGGNQ